MNCHLSELANEFAFSFRPTFEYVTIHAYEKSLEHSFVYFLGPQNHRINANIEKVAFWHEKGNTITFKLDAVQIIRELVILSGRKLDAVSDCNIDLAVLHPLKFSLFFIVNNHYRNI